MEKQWILKGTHNSQELLCDSLFKIRNITDTSIDLFLNPITPSEVFKQLDLNLDAAFALITKHINNHSNIVIYGDYDVDGISATTILYKTFKNYLTYENCFYFIPDRFNDGYGLSVKGIDKLNSIINSNLSTLIITVDCGITAVDACDYAKGLGYDIIISDHHQPGDFLPNPNVLVWSDKLVGAGVALALSERLCGLKEEFLGLACLATVTDLQPVIGYNRSIVKYGLDCLNSIHINSGLKELLIKSSIDKSLTTYDLGWVLGPRLNAAGRLESALESLNLLLCEDSLQRSLYAENLNKINQERQQKTYDMFEHAKKNINSSDHILIAFDEAYHEGVIGLVAGKLCQEFYKPAIAISVGPEHSKGSARSIDGVNIVDLLRSLPEFFENVGGHPMAAGFTVKTENLDKFIIALKNLCNTTLDKSLFQRVLHIDIEIPLRLVTFENYNALKQFEPFGMGNEEPVFASRNLEVVESRLVGSTGSHLKIKVREKGSTKAFDGIFFGGGHNIDLFNPFTPIDLAYYIKENTYNGYTNLNLHVKDFKISRSI